MMDLWALKCWGYYNIPQGCLGFLIVCLYCVMGVVFWLLLILLGATGHGSLDFGGFWA